MVKLLHKNQTYPGDKVKCLHCGEPGVDTFTVRGWYHWPCAVDSKAVFDCGGSPFGAPTPEREPKTRTKKGKKR